MSNFNYYYYDYCTIKALFQTGKIPTQADFENLINKIPNSDSWSGDNTLNLVNPQ